MRSSKKNNHAHPMQPPQILLLNFHFGRPWGLPRAEAQSRQTLRYNSQWNQHRNKLIQHPCQTNDVAIPRVKSHISCTSSFRLLIIISHKPFPLNSCIKNLTGYAQGCNVMPLIEGSTLMADDKTYVVRILHTHIELLTLAKDRHSNPLS